MTGQREQQMDRGLHLQCPPLTSVSHTHSLSTFGAHLRSHSMTYHKCLFFFSQGRFLLTLKNKKTRFAVGVKADVLLC